MPKSKDLEQLQWSQWRVLLGKLFAGMGTPHCWILDIDDTLQDDWLLVTTIGSYPHSTAIFVISQMTEAPKLGTLLSFLFFFSLYMVGGLALGN